VGKEIFSIFRRLSTDPDFECGPRDLWNDPQNLMAAMIIAILLHPKSSGRVVLQSNNPFDHPLIDPNYGANPEDVERLTFAFKEMQRIISHDPFKSMLNMSMECSQYGDLKTNTDHVRNFVRQSMGTVYHPVGTCKMGNILKDKMAVVDNKLRVKHIKNLRVIDASIMPTLPSGNTQAPCVMIGEKGAFHIYEDWKKNL